MIDFASNWLQVPVLGIVITGGVLVISGDRRTGLIALVLQYLGIAWLLAFIVPLQIVFIKIIAGLLTSTILFFTQRSLQDKMSSSEKTSFSTGRNFRALAFFIIMIASYGFFSSQRFRLIQLNDRVLLGAILLMGSGFIQVGIFQQPFAIGLGLLTLISGFEIIYTSLEPSLAMVALLAAVHCSLALVISYLELIVPRAKQGEGAPE